METFVMINPYYTRNRYTSNKKLTSLRPASSTSGTLSYIWPSWNTTIATLHPLFIQASRTIRFILYRETTRRRCLIIVIGQRASIENRYSGVPIARSSTCCYGCHLLTKRWDYAFSKVGAGGGWSISKLGPREMNSSDEEGNDGTTVACILSRAPPMMI